MSEPVSYGNTLVKKDAKGNHVAVWPVNAGTSVRGESLDSSDEKYLKELGVMQSEIAKLIRHIDSVKRPASNKSLIALQYAIKRLKGNVEDAPSAVVEFSRTIVRDGNKKLEMTSVVVPGDEFCKRYFVSFLRELHVDSSVSSPIQIQVLPDTVKDVQVIPLSLEFDLTGDAHIKQYSEPVIKGLTGRLTAEPAQQG